MKTKFLTISFKLLALSMLLFLLSQCKKDKLTVNTQSPSETQYSSIYDLLSKSAVKSQYFTIDQSSAVTITGNKGIEIYIPQNAFVDANNQVVTGSIVVELKEILSVKDMVLSNKQTVSNGEILESGGEFYINATSNGQKLFLGERLYITIPTTNLNYAMEVFTGDTNSNGDINWNLASGDSTWVTPSGDTLFGYTYVIWLDSIDYNFNWINCDAFNNDPNPKTDVLADVSPDSIYSDTSTVVFMVVPSTNSVYNMQGPNPFTAKNIPIGKVVTFIGFSYYNNKLYFGYKENVTVTSGIVEPLPLTEMSEQDMLVLLDQIL